MSALIDFADKALDVAALGLKALAFPRAQGGSGPLSNVLLPRTRYNYGQDIGEQGLGSSIVLAVISWIMRNFPAPLVVEELSVKDGREERTPVLPADFGVGAVSRLMRWPNPYYDGDLMLKALIVDYITAANAYVWKRRGALDRVVELWWLPKIYTRPRWATDGSEYIGYYEYNPNGAPMKIPPEDIIHFRDGLDPVNGREGLNRMAALAREIFTDDEASNFSGTILANLGVPGVVISPARQGTATSNRIVDTDSVKRAIKEKFSGDNRGEPLVLSAPTDVNVLSFSPQQMALRDLRKIPEERVSGVFGVAAIVAGLGAGLDRSTFANFAEARAASYEENVLPAHGSFANVIHAHLVPEFGDKLVHAVRFDVSSVKVLQEDADKKQERALAALSGGGITRRRFKEIIGESPDKQGKDDIYYIPSSIIVTNAEEPPPLLMAEQAEQEQADRLEVEEARAAAMPRVEPGVGGAARNGNGKGPRPAVGVGT